MACTCVDPILCTQYVDEQSGLTYCECTQNIPVSCPEGCIKDVETNTCTCTQSVPAVLGPVLTKIDIKLYLEEIRWTVSYDPKLKVWLSFHDWHPEWMIPSHNHFLTVKSDFALNPVCPPGYTFDPNTTECVKTVSSTELAQVIISETLPNIIPGEVPVCNCPTGYTLIGECNVETPPICKKVTCRCPSICEPDAVVSTTGECDDVVQAGTPGYINPNPLVCNSSYILTRGASNRISTIWRHNVRTDSFANYYNQDYPWEIEYSVVTPNTITTLRNFEYTLDVYKYYNNGKDFNHFLDENFDRAIVFNSEQNSGLLKLNLKTKNNPLTLLTYPVVNIDSIDIQYSKEENKFRFNQFYDVTADRGEFSNNTVPMWITAADGYHKIINPAYVDYAKQPLQHKKFRHYGNKIILRKNVSNDKKMILKFVNNKYQLSPR